MSTDTVSIFIYCKFGNFHDNFISGNSFKRHICHVKNLGIWYDLPTSTNKRVIFPFHEDFMKFRENKTLARISEIYSIAGIPLIYYD